MTSPAEFAPLSDTGAMNRDRMVLSARERAVHLMLSAVAVAGCMAAMAVWLEVAWQGPARWITALVGCTLAAQFAVWLAGWLSLPQMRRPEEALPAANARPMRVAAVTTFVSSHEPIDMLEQTLRAMAAMRVAHDTWVLDEQDSPQVRRLCERLGALHFSRAGLAQYQCPVGPYRSATKHGNYNAWLSEHGYDRYDVLAMFDTDQVPDARYLERTVGYLADAQVAYVQPPQVYYNQGASLVARGAAEESYAYYSTDLMTSYALGHTVVIGSHGVHRLEALRAVGGLPAHDAEDLYLTMLYRAAGWRGIYVPEILALGTTPADWRGYLQQQLRWARSILDLKIRVMPNLSGHLSIFERLLNYAHGAFYMRALMLPVAYAVLAILLVTGVTPAALHLDAVLVVVAVRLMVRVLELFRRRFYLDPRHERGVHWRSALLQFAKWPLFVRAVSDAVRGGSGAYLITPKGVGSGQRNGGLRSVAGVHLAVATALSAAWILGEVLHGSLSMPARAAAAVAVVLSLVVASSTLTSVPTEFSSEAYHTRHARLQRTLPV